MFFWLLTVYSDCRNLNKREIEGVRFDYGNANSEVINKLADLARQLMKDMRRNSQVVTMSYKSHGTMHIQCTYPKLSKLIIDDIDRVLGSHFGFSPEEIDFMINFNVKYRMGQGDDDQDE